MKFNINRIVLWLDNKEKRILKFEKDKVNVITGNSKTGKTAVLEIIDYCLCSTKPHISEEHIGEHVDWYGLDFNINDKHYFIARGNTILKSKEIYYSSTGIEPEEPNANMGMSELKEVLEKEFSINKNTVIPFGGKFLKQNSKISFRYFLMFNTISGDIIEHSKVYFDKQHDDRYREALPRIFDIATGISTIEDILRRNELDRLKLELIKQTKDKNLILNTIENRDYEVKKIIRQAVESKLLTSKIDNEQACIEELKNIIETCALEKVLLNDYSEQLEELKLERQNLEIQKQKLIKFKNRYNKYKKSLEEQRESLKPIEYIKNNFAQNIQEEEYLAFINMLEQDYINIRDTIRKKMPFECGIDDRIEQIEENIKSLDRQIDLIPQSSYIAIDDRIRLVLLGEIKNKFIELINNNISTENIDKQIEQTENKIEELEGKLVDYEDSKNRLIQTLNDYIQTYIVTAKNSLDIYGDYLSDYDYKNKILKLRKPKSASPANISSSSDHMYMHLCLFLGLHELFLANQSKYIPSFLIIDQPTRPYFVNEKHENLNNINYLKTEEKLSPKGDWNKVVNIFSLLDKFMANAKRNNFDYQMIVLEHVAKEAWTGLDSIHLVEEFDGEKNALIPPVLCKDKQ